MDADAVSAELHARRAAFYREAFEDRDERLRLTRRSLAWRLTEPLRLALDLAAGRRPPEDALARDLRKAWRIARTDGWREAWRRARRRAAPLDSAAARARAAEIAAVARQPQGRSPDRLFTPRVLIVAELSIPQCAKYRVWQKQAMIEALGVACEVVDWRNEKAACDAAQFATLAILYRVPFFPEAQTLLAEIRRLRLRVLWEVDDLIFDEAAYRGNRNLDQIDEELRRSVLDGIVHYRQAMLACDGGIASTSGLAEAMRAAGIAETHVVENALDAETLRIAAAIRAERGPRDPGVRIGYGSGTRTHDADFAQAAPALRRLLAEKPDARLRLMGDLDPGPGFEAFGERVERLPRSGYAAYLRALAGCDISIAPLEPTLFNDAKSAIKHLEASILGIASVCSPRAAFRDAMSPGVDGLFADNDAEWFEALCRLADDAGLRRALGEAAEARALARYRPEAMARRAVAPILAQQARRAPARLRVLIANIYYAPRSFGGATLVAEEMARRLAARPEVAVTVVCGAPPPHEGALRRWEADGIPVFGLPVPERVDAVTDFDDPVMGAHFARVLKAAAPDVVHLHSLQGLGVDLARACRRAGIPYVITLHDAWFLCARQFMVTGEGRYCFQTEIDLNICQACFPEMAYLHERQAILRDALDGAALLLSPGESHAALHRANGVDPGRLRVAPNGVVLPARPRPPRPAGAPLRLAYVGGRVAVKGYDLLREALAGLGRSDYTLILVDNTLNLGFPSIDRAEWRIGGTIEIVPAYARQTMDAFFEGIDVLLFPSRWKESFGLTVREALARHVWVVASDGGGPAEAIVDQVNGTLVPFEAGPAAWRAALQAVLEDPARRTDWRNPLADTVQGFDAQADALHAMLVEVAQGATLPGAEAA